MDEIEFQVAYGKLRTLIDHVPVEDGGHTRNAMLIIIAMLDSLNQRLVELAQTEDDDE